jgi:flagellar motor switch protein FliN/FliY
MVETDVAVKVEEKAEDKEEKDTAQGNSKTQVQSVEFSEASAAEAAGAAGSIDILLDMNVPVTVAIGQTEISVRRLLQLGPGSVLQLDKAIDSPADLYLRDAKFATGTVVVVDDRFAVRIKRILGLGDSAANTAGT